MSGTSIASLFLYFLGWLSMSQGVLFLLIPGAVLLSFLYVWSRTPAADLARRIVDGVWAGAVATFAYDIVRVPIAHSGIPVFKAISYFGTVIVGEPAPTLSTEVVGWLYHLSNGISFALIYVLIASAPRLITAVLWGLMLELGMLLTPYAEIFGYKLSPAFLAITIGSHVVYGIVLWAALVLRRKARLAATALLLHKLASSLPFWGSLFGIALIAADFHAVHARSIPASPPPYIGKHLYTTWNALEPDRVVALWVLKRFVDPAAEFHFIEPFSKSRFGVPFDIPESEFRRTGGRSTTEILLQKNGLDRDPRLELLGRVTHLYEISPWLMPSDRTAFEFGNGLKSVLAKNEASSTESALAKCFDYLDNFMAHSSSSAKEKM